MKRYVTLLRNEPLLRRLSLIQLLAYFGAWFSNVAIYTLLIQMGAEATTIALVAALHFLPGVFQAPLSGVILDRIHPKKLMILLTLIEIFCTLSLISIDNIGMLWLLYLLVFIRMGASSFHFTVEMSLLPRILEGKSLQTANEIHSIIWSISYTLGMALSGLVVYWVGVTMAFILDAGLFVIVLTLISKIKIEVELSQNGSKLSAMMREAFTYIRANPIVYHLMILHAVLGFTAFDALVALAAKQYYSQIIAVSLGIGLLNAARAFGLVIGPMVLGRWINNARLGWLFLAEAGAIALWALLIDDFYGSLIASVAVGFVTTTLWSYTYTLLQHHTQSDFYGRVIAYNDMVFLGVGAFVSLLIGYLAASGITLGMITLILGGVFLIAAFYYEWVRRTYELKEFE
ncbi:MAG: MFS transporter [Sulfuricurvum sp. GWF2_44_89]|uniref:MFS transporter n=1 Tax=Sulfuricurvum kujiense TaxID=148813 RepID=A0A2D3WM62_9BACT|nr:MULTISPECIES: MFS transporter [Sulfuricurvum]OHD77577.1 MAG: MFS transporter [Sulfuricurvum sp. GWF2_44_89]OHD92521.1 MAG: MFS transporter [Sulfuricurvum sp. RIFOXYD2_FULL_44_160]OHD96512.1 MAG: MFS transporter [Sulfuricurvum sp. RIFOXYD12_FULL_44_77]DAB38794.1 MAG TPA: MFS transporter [Sulfuricurvum kujiense]